MTVASDLSDDVVLLSGTLNVSISSNRSGYGQRMSFSASDARRSEVLTLSMTDESHIPGVRKDSTDGSDEVRIEAERNTSALPEYMSRVCRFSYEYFARYLIWIRRVASLSHVGRSSPASFVVKLQELDCGREICLTARRNLRL